jgi:hypothetical protein
MIYRASFGAFRIVFSRQYIKFDAHNSSYGLCVAAEVAADKFAAEDPLPLKNMVHLWGTLIIHR